MPPSEHSDFAPSSIYRVIACPASWQLCKTVPPKPPNEFAVHGTLLHKVVEHVKDNNMEMYYRLKSEDQGYVQDCIDHVKLLKGGKDPAQQVYSEWWERRVKLDSWGVSDVWGTADHVLEYLADGICHITDWKFGQGVQVFAENNEQAMCYAAGAVGFPCDNFEKIFIHIVQPPLDHFDVWEITPKYLKDWVFDVLTPAIKAATETHPKFTPGEKQCRFCPAGVECPARVKLTIANAKELFAHVNILEQVSDDKFTYLLSISKQVEGTIKAIKTYGIDRGLRGKPIEGTKVVAGRSIRKWLDDRKAASWLADNTGIEYLITKVISPAQAEKKARDLKKDKEFHALITKGQGKPVLVPDSDKRQPMVVDAFKDVRCVSDGTCPP